MGKKSKKSKNTLSDGNSVFQEEVCVIGAGYVGVVTAAVLASKHPHIKFIVTDVDQKKIMAWQTVGSMPIQEPDLQDLIYSPNLEFSDDVENALLFAKIIFIAVGPPAESARKALLTVHKSMDNVPRVGREPTDLYGIIATIVDSERHLERTIVIRSTLPPGTAERIEEKIYSSTGSHTAWNRLHVYVNPEILAQGTAVKNFNNPDVVVLGASTCSSIRSEAFYNLKSLYSSWVPEERILTMTATSAALFKLANNALLAQQVSTMNALATICTAFNTKNQKWIGIRFASEEKATRPDPRNDLTASDPPSSISNSSRRTSTPGSFRPGEANVTDVIEALGRNTRISTSGTAYLQPGLGFGGSCLENSARDLGSLAKGLDLPRVYVDQFYQTWRLNEAHREFSFRTVLDACGRQLEDKTFAVIGLTYKVGTDDIRGSVARDSIARLVAEGAHAVNVYDPLVTPEAFRSCWVEGGFSPDLPVILRRDLRKACMGASCVIIVNAYPVLTPQDPGEYCRLWTILGALLHHPKIIFDTRNCLDDSFVPQCKGGPVRVVRMGSMEKRHYDHDQQRQELGQHEDDSSNTAAETP